MSSLTRRRRLVTICISVLALNAGLLGQERRPEGGRGGREGMSPRMNPLFAALDTNGDGVIDAQEIANAAASLPKHLDEMVARLMQLDRDGDGRLSKEELPERMAGLMARGDTNQDGFLSRDELIALARSMATQGVERERGRDEH